MRVLPGIILSVVVAVVSWNCSDSYADQRDKDIREVLDSPGVVEKFKKTQGKQTQKSKDNESPLVKEAKSFALYLNPPQQVEKRPANVNKETKSIVKQPTNVSAKFKVVGTSCAADPSMSLALLDIAGKGLRWIRQGESVGHLVIEEVKPGGTIVVRDGKNTSEMTSDKPVKMSLLKGNQPDMKELSGQIETMLSASSDLQSKTSNTVTKPQTRPKLSEEEIKQQQQVMKDLMVQVEQMLKTAEKPDSSDASGETGEKEIQLPEATSEQLMEQLGQIFEVPADDTNSSAAPDGTKSTSETVETDTKPEVEKPQDEASDVLTVEDVSGLMDKLSEKLEQVKSDNSNEDAENVENSVQDEAEFVRKAILKLKTAEISSEDKVRLQELDKELAKIQQDIRRSQSRKRIESVRRKPR